MEYTNQTVLENKLHKNLWVFEIQRDRWIQDRWPNLKLINKKKRTCHLVDFNIPTDHSVKKLKKLRRLQIPGSCLRTKNNAVEHKGVSTTIAVGARGNVDNGLWKSGLKTCKEENDNL